MDRVPLPIKELFALHPGDRFVVYYAKDDNPRDVRLNFVEQIVAEIDKDGDIVTADGYNWMHRRGCDEERNELNTGRGHARFFRREQP